MSIIHWKYRNQIDTGTVFRYSSQIETLPAINIQTDILRRVWRTNSGFIITQYNREFVFRDTATGSPKQFSIPSGTYTGSGLISQIRTQLNSTGDYTNHSGTYNSTTGKFTIRRTSGTTFRLLFSTAIYWPNSAAVLLGFNNRTDYTGSLVYSATSFGNEHEVIVSFTSTQSVNCFIIDKHNFSSGTVIRLRGTRSTSTVFSGGWNSSTSIIKSSTISHNTNKISIEFTATRLKHIQLYWYDRSLSYSEIGRLWASIFFSPQFQTATNNWCTWKKKTIDLRSDTKMSEAGVTFFNRKNPVNSYDIITHPLDPYYNPSTKSGYESMINYIGNDKSFYISLDSNLNTSTIYGYMTSKVVFTRLDNTPVINLGTISIREQL
jgi:hypothetical protein